MSRVVIDAKGGFEAGPMLAYLRAHTIPGAEISDPERGRHTRLLTTGAEATAVTVCLGDDEVSFEADVEDVAQTEDVATAVRAWLGLDADLEPMRAALGKDPTIGPLLAARPGLRVIGYPDGFEGVVMTLLGQQVSLAAARTFGGRFAAAFGEPDRSGLIRFPSPERIAAEDPEVLRAAIGTTGARAATIRATAAAFADGLMLAPGVDYDDARRRLHAIKGIGDWTVEYLALRALRDPDACPNGDLVLKNALGAGSTAEAAEITGPWRPWRAYAVLHLWTASAFAAP